MEIRTMLRRMMVMSVALLFCGVALVPGPANAGKGRTGDGKTVEYVLHVAALPVDNLCNADAVILNGDLRIHETTTARGNGYTVRSSINGKNMRGFGLPSALDYRAEDREDSYAYYAPPPYPTTFYDTHYTKLVPQGNAPSMYLVIVLKEVVLADGTVVPTINRMFLVCQQPSHECHHA